MGKDTLTGARVKHAMRHQLVDLNLNSSIDACIQYLIKYKINAILVNDAHERPIGVVSKTDILGAYYSGMPLSSPVETIMTAPPLFCSPEDFLYSALNTMKDHNVDRLYVLEGASKSIVGTISYADVVGLLYHYCRYCNQSFFKRTADQEEDSIKRYRVKEIMARHFDTCLAVTSLSTVIEILSGSGIGAVPVVDDQGCPKGIISKTDITLCYRHGVDLSAEASSIMTSPVIFCSDEELVENAIKLMILKDLYRLFVVPEEIGKVVGVVSLTDAARKRSGSCRACISSRIEVDKA